MSQITITKGKLLKDDKVEIWKDIEGYEGLYQVSNLSRVKSLARVKAFGFMKDKQSEEVILATYPLAHGYEITAFYKDGKKIQKTIHRLVAKAFLPNPDNKPQINHKNGVRSDNRLENLEWCTSSENILHSYRTLKRKAPISGVKGANNKLSKPVYVTNISTGKRMRFASLTLACEATKSKTSKASRVCSGKRKSHNGYLFKYPVKNKDKPSQHLNGVRAEDPQGKLELN